MGGAGQRESDGEGGARAQPVARVGQGDAHPCRAGDRVHAAVDGIDPAREGLAGIGRGARADLGAGLEPAEIGLGKVEADEDLRAVVEAGDHRLGADPVAGLDLWQAGDAVEGRAQGPVRERRLRLVPLEPRDLARGARFGKAGGGGHGARLERLVAFEHPFGLGKACLGEREREALVGVLEPQEHRSGRGGLARRQAHLHDLPGRVGPQGDGALRPPGSHRLEDDVVRALGDTGHHDRHARGPVRRGRGGLARGDPHPLRQPVPMRPEFGASEDQPRRQQELDDQRQACAHGSPDIAVGQQVGRDGRASRDPIRGFARPAGHCPPLGGDPPRAPRPRRGRRGPSGTPPAGDRPSSPIRPFARIRPARTPAAPAARSPDRGSPGSGRRRAARPRGRNPALRARPAGRPCRRRPPRVPARSGSGQRHAPRPRNGGACPEERHQGSVVHRVSFIYP